MKRLLLFGIILILLVGIVSAAGTIEFIIGSGTGQESIVYLKESANPVSFESTYNHDLTIIEDQNIGWRQVEVQPDGISFPVDINTGDYTACLQNGMAGKQECQDFSIADEQHQRIFFIGHVIGADHAPEITPIPEPTLVPSPTPLPIPVPCHNKRVWHPGHWETRYDWSCGEWSLNCFCHWIPVPHWTPGYWETIKVCPE